MTDARTICDALAGRWYGGYGLAYCPAHKNTFTPALSVKDGDDGRLLIHCFAGCAGVDVLGALRARGLLAGRSDWQPDPHEIVRRELKRQVMRRRRIEQAKECWAESTQIAGTLAEKYLRARGITCQLPPTLRFHPNCWHGPSATKVPALVAAVTNNRKLVAIHRTYLAEPGSKAFGDKSKMMLGPCSGSAVRLSGGRGPLVVAEGIETALSLLSGLPDAGLRIWAALSTSGVSNLGLPQDPGELVLAPDGDAPGREAADKLANRACGIGWSVSIMDIPDGADWNDLSEGVAA